jgi:hypothetical protein
MFVFIGNYSIGKHFENNIIKYYWKFYVSHLCSENQFFIFIENKWTYYPNYRWGGIFWLLANFNSLVFNKISFVVIRLIYPFFFEIRSSWNKQSSKLRLVYHSNKSSKPRNEIAFFVSLLLSYIQPLWS